MSPRTVVETQLDAYLVDLGGLGSDREVWLSWSQADPWAVLLEVPSATGVVVEWRFDRELLWVGLNRPTGQGDVRIAPVADPADDYFCDLAVSLFGPGEGWAHLYLDRGELWEFLQSTKPHFASARDAARAGLDSEITDLIDQYGGVL